LFFKQAEEKLLAKNQDKEYAPIHGLPDFTVPSAKLAFGEDSEVIKNSLVSVTFQFARHWSGHPCRLDSLFLISVH